MYPHWTELRSYGQERLQQRIAEADEWQLARRVAPAPAASPTVWQTLAGAVQRFASLRVRRAERARAQARLTPTRA